ncbi:cupin domain-containing protein [Halarcobacter ebronensis]|uniref:Cupin n=1 Tax=Halarcobacter ebronensis TaxID=1462615 RepID=A0A4V1M0W1_9BACT|nr:cupin domain-containing protein [Halarcobacter ebronensis]QKF80737.1 Cupin domain-containing protein [Halarcobacter ebronensis]RXK08530.1 cupin [Halarcobacter ebronensis]
MKSYELVSFGNELESGRVELHDKLNLTGAEVSFNNLPKGVSVPFVHKHKENEEIYVVLEGKGFLYIDKEEIEIKKGDAFRIDPNGARCIKASDESSLYFFCVQAKVGSLKQFTRTDGLPCEDEKPSWL